MNLGKNLPTQHFKQNQHRPRIQRLFHRRPILLILIQRAQFILLPTRLLHRVAHPSLRQPTRRRRFTHHVVVRSRRRHRRRHRAITNHSGCSTSPFRRRRRRRRRVLLLNIPDASVCVWLGPDASRQQRPRPSRGVSSIVCARLPTARTHIIHRIQCVQSVLDVRVVVRVVLVVVLVIVRAAASRVVSIIIIIINVIRTIGDA